MKDEGGAGKNLVSEAIKLDFEMEKRNMTQNIVASESLETELKMELMTEKQIMGMSFHETSSIDCCFVNKS